ncbi:unnamed protein product [Acidithrix sp. C25]|nr:unnamed protein product [Acidithrix sp. C25]
MGGSYEVTRLFVLDRHGDCQKMAFWAKSQFSNLGSAKFI